MGSVLTVYHPWQPGTMGRAVLTEGDRPKLAADIVSALSQIIPDLHGNIEQIVLDALGACDQYSSAQLLRADQQNQR